MYKLRLKFTLKDEVLKSSQIIDNNDNPLIIMIISFLINNKNKKNNNLLDRGYLFVLQFRKFSLNIQTQQMRNIY